MRLELERSTELVAVNGFWTSDPDGTLVPALLVAPMGDSKVVMKQPNWPPLGHVTVTTAAAVVGVPSTVNVVRRVG